MASYVVTASIPTEEDSAYEMLMDRTKADPSGWIMWSTPGPMLLILLLYSLMLYLGPRLMENREPYKLKTVMRLYNIFQVIHNMYMVYSFIENPEALPYAIRSSCSLVNILEDLPNSLSNAYFYYCWNFLISKHIDLLDTVFMVLRKKNSHITFLHVYHHVAMVFSTWFTIGYTVINPHSVIPGLINVTIHSIMYSYYFLATFRRFKRLLWWKHHLTKLQLGQFVIILTYIFMLYYYRCPVSRRFTFTWAFHVFVFLVLFINFYVKAYLLKSEATDKNTYKERTKKDL